MDRELGDYYCPSEDLLDRFELAVPPKKLREIVKKEDGNEFVFLYAGQVEPLVRDAGRLSVRSIQRVTSLILYEFISSICDRDQFEACLHAVLERSADDEIIRGRLLQLDHNRLITRAQARDTFYYILDNSRWIFRRLTTHNASITENILSIIDAGLDFSWLGKYGPLYVFKPIYTEDLSYE